MPTKTTKYKVPATRDSGELRILVETLEREEQSTAYFTNEGIPVVLVDAQYDPYKELSRIINNGKYKLELVRGYLTTDKPLLIIKEITHEKD